MERKKKKQKNKQTKTILTLHEVYTWPKEIEIKIPSGFKTL